MNPIPYLFLHLQDEILTQDTIDLVNQAKEVHLFYDIPNSISLPYLSSSSVYVYCFNKTQIENCLKLGYVPHICVYGNDLFSSSLFNDYQDENYEYFWFPHLKNILFDSIKETASILSSFQNPICISLNSIFNPDTVNEMSRLWLKQLYQEFKNPLLLKEKKLLNTESFQNDNFYIKQFQLMMTKEHIILGIHGDFSFIDLKTYLLSNVKMIKKTPDCIDCSYSQSCINRGLGYVLKSCDYKGCIGIKLLE